MEHMAKLPDKYYDLAIVDPPYGIGVNMNCGEKKHERKKYINKRWDSTRPTNEYFIELFRISYNQIIFGIDYFDNITGNGRIKWDKDISGEVSFSKYEMAYQSFDNEEYYYKYRIQNNRPFSRIHPTQKPIALYKWLLKNYAKPGQTIFDSHVGSGSIRIACHDLGFDFEGCEIDADYWQAQEKRYQNHINQAELFDKKEIQKLAYKNEELF
jgi:site-specific DNA-methyltransferase (adenine-specific)